MVPAIRATLAGDAATLRRYYDIGFSGDLTRWRLVLTPLSSRVLAAVQRISIEGEGGTVLVVERRGRELQVPHIHTHERSKLACMQRIAAGMGIGMDQVAFVGDDLPDLATMRAVGLAIAPANAHHWILPVAHWVTPRRGGEGAGRDACDLLLHAQGHVDGILAHGEHP